ncbi:MAG: 2-C-methyl-D-erythritol 4-phosphate cytidylyltransferase [Ignavibacteria bacterium]|nr:2-C-methyl-D-erythritol 4-phosphate cytidylyltransferase [Ignavibacteria bacterium]
MKVYAIIPSGGTGSRIKNPIPKQYIKVNDKEIISYSLDVFQKCDLIDEIIVPVQNEYLHFLQEIKKRYSFTKISKIIEGGSERQFSVFNALKTINASDDDIIIVHDAVRPLLSIEILTNSIAEAIKKGAVIVAIKANDTLIKFSSHNLDYINRDEIFYVQTPQVFNYKILIDSMLKAEQINFVGTDESMLVKNAGYKLSIVEGSLANFKITTNYDLELFKKLVDKLN